MTTREKIIVGLMCLTIIYGAYELIGSRKPRNTTTPKSENTIGELKSFVAGIGQKLNAERTTEENRYVIEQAGSAWEKDPFINSSKPLRKKPVSAITEPEPKYNANYPQFIYSGFIQMGSTKIAIINGIEYMEGESLADETFYVKSISPQKVAIGNIKGSEIVELSIRENESEPGE